MSWVLMPDLATVLVENPTTGVLGDPVQIDFRGQAATGIIIGLGSDPDAAWPSELAGRELANNVLAKARNLGSGDANAQDHFKSHGETVWRALGRAGTKPDFNQFIEQLTRLVSSGDLRLVAAVVVSDKFGQAMAAKPTVEYKFQGQVGTKALTMLMQPNGDWHTLWETGTGADRNLVVALQMLGGSLLPPQVGAFAGLARALELLQALERDISRQKGQHSLLASGKTPTFFEGVAAAVLGPAAVAAAAALGNPTARKVMGAGVDILNPAKMPPLSVWKRAEDFVAGGQMAWAARSTEKAVAAAMIGRGHYLKADRKFTEWRDGIELAGRRAQVVIGAAAATAVAAAIAVFAIEAAAGVAVSSTAGATTQTGQQIAGGLADKIVRIATAETLRQEQLAEGEIIEEVVKLKARALGR